MRPKSFAPCLVIAVALITALAVATRGTKRDEGSTTVRLITATDFKEILQAHAIERRPILVNFWATWCHGCRQEMPDLVKIDHQYHSQGLEFITVSLDKNSEIDKGVPLFLRDVGGSILRAYLMNPDDIDSAMKIADPNWQGQMPATFLYDSEGKLSYSHKGVISPSEVKTAIEKVLVVCSLPKRSDK